MIRIILNPVIELVIELSKLVSLATVFEMPSWSHLLPLNVADMKLKKQILQIYLWNIWICQCELSLMWKWTARYFLNSSKIRLLTSLFFYILLEYSAILHDQMLWEFLFSMYNILRYHTST